MKRFLLLQMVLVISASAQQWIEADNKDLVRGKTTVSFGLCSQPPLICFVIEGACGHYSSRIVRPVAGHIWNPKRTELGRVSALS
jgi:hypothetical protein